MCCFARKGSGSSTHTRAERKVISNTLIISSLFRIEPPFSRCSNVAQSWQKKVIKINKQLCCIGEIPFARTDAFAEQFLRSNVSTKEQESGDGMDDKCRTNGGRRRENGTRSAMMSCCRRCCEIYDNFISLFDIIILLFFCANSENVIREMRVNKTVNSWLQLKYLVPGPAAAGSRAWRRVRSRRQWEIWTASSNHDNR